MSDSTVQSLTDWFQSRLTAHFEQSDAPEADFQKSFDAMIAPDAQIFFNHESVSVGDFKEKLAKGVLTAKSRVEWRETQELIDKDSKVRNSLKSISPLVNRSSDCWHCGRRICSHQNSDY